MDTNNSINVNFIFSLIGCITGTAGFTISFILFIRTLLRERKNIKINFHPLHCGYFHKIKIFSDYVTDYHGILHIQITNKSSAANTINYFDTYIGNQMIQFRVVDVDKIDIFTNNKNESISLPLKPHFQLPIRLEPYDVKEFMIFYPVLPEITTDLISGHVIVGSAKGKIKKSFVMSNINNIDLQSSIPNLLNVKLMK